jgi:AcrR family transcriptional regulator
MCREEVARNQRTRIYGAMIEAVWRRGYRNAAVADVLALAGVSRRAFYEHFANKEACFLATFDIVVARERRRLIDAWENEHGWSNRMHAACKSLLAGTARDPKGARLVLIEAHAVQSSAEERMHLAAATFERLIATAYSLTPDRRLGPSAAKAIAGGLRHVILIRLLERREHELHGMTDEVLDWIESYHSHTALPLTTPAPLAPASPARPACVDAVARGPSPFEMVIAHALDAAREPVGGPASWPQAVHRSIAGFVARLLSSPALLQRAAREPLADPRTIAWLDELARVLSAGAPAPRRGPAVAREAVAGGLWAIIASHASEDRLARLPRAVDHLAFTLLAPYLGARSASDSIRAVGTLPPGG